MRYNWMVTLDVLAERIQTKDKTIICLCSITVISWMMSALSSFVSCLLIQFCLFMGQTVAEALS